MPVRRYDRDELLALRDSPLVTKPDNLPAIEQWIEYVYLETRDGVREKLRIPHSEAQQQHHQASASSQQTPSKENGGGSARQRQQRAAASAVAGDGASPMGSFSTGQRPGLLSTRSGTLRGQGDDVSLGPPRTMFPSSSRVSKLSDFQDRTDAPSDESESARSRFFSDRTSNRKGLGSEKEGRDTRESWTSARERRAMGDSEDHHGRDRHERFGRHDKEQDGERRNGYGDRHEPRWGARDERRPNGDRAGGWREREHQRRERDNDRGHGEKEPEWMDEPVVQKDQEPTSGIARTQEEFQKWKEGMNKKSKPQPEKEEPPETQADLPVLGNKPATVAPLKLDGLETNMFGGWGGSSRTISTPQSEAAPAAKSATGKGKTSRFASMFKPAVEDAPTPAAVAAAETAFQKAQAEAAKTSLEDQEGFNRVLQMLGSTKVGQTPVPGENMPTSPLPGLLAGSNGSVNRPKSRFTDVFEQKSPERLQSPPQPGGFPPKAERGLDGHVRHPTNDSIHQFGGKLPERQGNEQVPRHKASESNMSPEPQIPFNALREQQPRPSSGRITDSHPFSPPSRGAATPDINIQNLLAQQRQRPQATSNESQQLLDLLKKDTGPRPPTQQPMVSNGGMDQAQFQRWMENQRMAGPSGEPHAPKPRLPQPPGLFEEQLMRHISGDQARHEQTPSMGSGQDMPQRRQSQRVPPGFLDEKSMLMLQHQQQQQQMRRNYADGLQQQQQQQQPMQPPNPRLASHHNLPPMQIPLPQGGGLQYAPDFHQLTSPGGAGGPPPGFSPMMPRLPSGFHNMPNLYANVPQPRDGPLPPGFGGGGNGGAAGPPPGFVPMPNPMGHPAPPPGFMPHMRSPTEVNLPPGLQRGGVLQHPPGRGGGFDGGFDHSAVGQPRR